MNEYNANSIETLEFRSAVRRRIGMYLGSADMQGVYQSLQEIISNSVDEFLVGYGTEIYITISKTAATIQDFGRGIPVGKREDGTEVLEAIFLTSHTGGKFSDKAYPFAAGLNGIGAKATCLSSDEFNVIVCYNGIVYGLKVVDGYSQGVIQLRKMLPNEKTGTTISFRPSAEVFNLEPIYFDFEVIKKKVQNMSYLTKGLTFHLLNQETGEQITYCSNGLTSLIKEKVTNAIHKTPLHISVSDGNISAEIVAQWAKSAEKAYCFTNGIENPEGGTPITGFRTAITRSINKMAGTSLSGDIIRRGLVYAISIKIPNPSFANQTKTKVNNPELRSLCDRGCTEMIKAFFEEHPDEKKIIIEKLVKEEKAEAAAERARNKILEATKEVAAEAKKKSVLAGKLIDCREHGERSILMIAEGNSAAEAIVGARNSDFVAVLPLRGKIISCLKHPPEKVLDNDVIKELMIALGCGIEENCNIKKLRYGKVGIFVDADVDGYSIMCLILTFFYRYMPRLLEEGRICWVRAPLYRIEKGKNRYYAYSDEELKTLPKGEITRYKGVGESTSEDLRATVFASEDNYVSFTMEDAENANHYFHMLMGDNVEIRRNFIFKNADFERLED